jgi:hypothetical protein
MSTDITILPKRDVMLGSIVPATADALRELLNLVRAPALTIEIMSGGRLYAIEPRREGVPGDLLVIELEGREGGVSLLFNAVPAYGGILQYACASVGAPNEPLDFALGAAVAVAVARLTEGTLEDDDLSNWSGRSEEQSPEDFVASIRLVEAQQDIEKAARLFYERTILAQFNKRYGEERGSGTPGDP